MTSFPAFAASDGVWAESPSGLPYCKYDGRDADQSFLLGNYRMNVITHSDGMYQIVSGERVWARFNADPYRINAGRNRAEISWGRTDLELAGPNPGFSEMYNYEVYSGIGFTRYDYRLKNGIKCSRMISVMPSEDINEGNPCFVITVTLSNVEGRTKKVSYSEAFSPMYMPVADHFVADEDRAFTYPMTTEITFRCLKGYFMPQSQKFMGGHSPVSSLRHEVAPQSVFLYSPDAFLCISEGEFKALFYDIRLRPGEKKTFNIVVGLTMGEDARKIGEKVLSHAGNGQFGLFEAQWKRILPSFQNEMNRTVRREMLMNAHALEAAAVYDSYFNETFVPGESGSVFMTGANLSNRDHLECALPLCWTNPDLAKSTMKYVMKHAEADGRIYGGNIGYGYIPSSCMIGYHELQVYFIRLLAEYIRASGDYDFLDESVTLHSGKAVKVISFVESCFIYLRDEISQTADTVSMMNNHSLVSSCFTTLISELKESELASDEFLKALEEYQYHAWNTYRSYEEDLPEDNSNEKSISLYNYFKTAEGR